MRAVRIFLILLVFFCTTISLLSGTFAKYASESGGTDTALVAKWNFNVAEFNGSFALIEASELMPQASGYKTFTVSSGGSDTAIDFNVTMNVDEFKGLGGHNAPLIFRVTVPEDVTQPAATTGWFSLNSSGITEDFIIAEGSFAEGDTTSYTIRVDWWWNTSFYVSPGNGLTASDTDLSPDYYDKAVISYNSALASYNSALAAEEEYASHYVLYPEQTHTDEEGNVTVVPAYYAWDNSSYTAEGYSAMQTTTENLHTVVANHTKNQYDNYDTDIMTALVAEVNVPKVGFTANGGQTVPS